MLAIVLLVGGSQPLLVKLQLCLLVTSRTLLLLDQDRHILMPNPSCVFGASARLSGKCILVVLYSSLETLTGFRLVTKGYLTLLDPSSQRERLQQEGEMFIENIFWGRVFVKAEVIREA